MANSITTIKHYTNGRQLRSEYPGREVLTFTPAAVGKYAPTGWDLISFTLPNPVTGDIIEFVAAIEPAEEIEQPIPDTVKQSVDRAIANIKETNLRLLELRAFDIKINGGGRYECDGFRNHLQGAYYRAELSIDKFRKQCVTKNIDAAKHLNAWGYVAPECLSAQAKEWL